MNTRERNLAVWRFLLLPLAFLTVVLLGGLRVGAERENFVFIQPPLICLILAALLMLLFLRGRLVVFGEWLSHDFPLLTNAANAVTLAALFFASAQVFNSVMPESGLLHWFFALFFLWTLWNNLFSEFDARRLLRSLAVLFGTAFLLKHLILAAFSAPEESTWWKIANLIFENVPRSALGAQNFAPATGYISFFALALYVLAIAGLSFATPPPEENENVRRVAGEITALTPHEQNILVENFEREKLKVASRALDDQSLTAESQTPARD